MRGTLALAIAGAALTCCLRPTVAWSGTLVEDVVLEHDGLTRYFEYYVPDGLPDSPVPLLFVFHGAGLDNDNVRWAPTREFMSLADEELFIVLIPNGTTKTGETGPSGEYGWNHCRPANPRTADDVGFVSALIDWAATLHDIDLERVYATGFSNGGHMSYRLAFELSDRIAAIGVQIANLSIDSECPDLPANPLAVLVMNGTADPRQEWDGEPHLLSAHETRDFWRTFLATDESPTHIDVPDIDPNDDSTVEIDLYSKGAEGSQVAFYTVNGGGHRLASIAHPFDDPATELEFGKQNHDIESAAEIWNFLKHHRLSGSAQVPLGPEFQVNSYTTGLQYHASVAIDAEGTFVVVWTSEGSFGNDTDSFSIQGQRYAADGAVLGDEFQVNSYTTGAQRLASVAAAAEGDFVVVWQSDGSYGSDTDETSIQAQQFASDGTPLGIQFQVNTVTTNKQREPSVAAVASGDFVVVWSSWVGSGGDSFLSIEGQRFSSDGMPLDDQFQVNTFPDHQQEWPAVAVDADGDFVVVWKSNGTPGEPFVKDSIRGQLFASDATPLGDEFQVNTYTAGAPPSVASEANGDFIVVWEGWLGIDGQRFASDGTPLGGEFQVNTYTADFDWFPSVAADADGEFVVAWTGTYLEPLYYGGFRPASTVEGQRFASDGTPLGSQFQVNTQTADYWGFQLPAVAAEADGDFVVVWPSGDSPNHPGPDGDQSGVQGQRFVPEPNTFLLGISALATLALLAQLSAGRSSPSGSGSVSRSVSLPSTRSVT